MPKLMVTTGAQDKVVYESSAAPSDFGNASPFRKRSTTRDPARLVVFGIAAIAFLTFLASMIAVLFMHAP
jgi:hypothetical protein